MRKWRESTRVKTCEASSRGIGVLLKLRLPKMRPDRPGIQTLHDHDAFNGIDVEALAIGADGAAALKEAAARAKTQALEERTAAEREDGQAAQLLAEADRADKAHRENVDAEYPT